MTIEAIAAVEPRDRPMARPGDVKLPEFERRLWRHILPDDVDWHEALGKDYWSAAEVLAKLAPGDRVEIFTGDYSIGLEILVTEVVGLAGHIRFLPRPLFPADLELPAPSPGGEEPRYYPRLRQGADRLWEVVDRASGLPVKARIVRAAADAECFTRNQADRDARTLVAASAAREGPGEAAAAALLGSNEVAAAPVPAPEPEAASPADIDEIDDLTGLPRPAQPAEDVAAELAALGRAAEQPKEEAR